MSENSASYELNVSYDYDSGEEDPIFRIADQFGFTHCASGAGFGDRDIHFERDTPPTDEEIAKLKHELQQLPFTVSASIEEWKDLGFPEGDTFRPEDVEDNKTWSIIERIAA